MIRIIPPTEAQPCATVIAESSSDRLDSVDTAELRTLLTEYGAVLFRNFPLDQQSFDALTSRFCNCFAFNESRGRKTVSADGRTRTVNLGEREFPLHAELAREPWKPDIAFFACATPPESGGETTYCDGVQIVRALSDETRELLLANQLQHRIPSSAAEFTHWQQVFGDNCPFELTVENGEHFRTFYTPVLHKTLLSGELAFANFLLFARYFHNIRTFPTFAGGEEIADEICEQIRLAAESLTTAHHWQQSDILMLDNTRFMHGRKAVTDVDHRVILTQFGYASFATLTPAERQRQPWRTPRANN